MNCCGSSSIKQKPSDVLKAIAEKKQALSPPPINPQPSIPQSVKEQLIVNQQLMRLNKNQE